MCCLISSSQQPCQEAGGIGFPFNKGGDAAEGGEEPAQGQSHVGAEPGRGPG